MSGLHPANNYNVEATLNAWMRGGLLNISRPSFLPAFDVVFTMPDRGIAPPAVSVSHVGLDHRQPWGGVRGLRAGGLMDISVWATRKNNPNWLPQLMTLQAMVTQVRNTVAVVVIADYSTPGAPAPTSYKIDLGALEPVTVSQDPNPDIERRRMLLRYEWTVRS